MTNLFQRLRDLVPLPPVLVGIVIEHHDDDTSTVEIPGNLPVTGYSGTVATGSLIRPRGTTVPVGQKAFVRAGVIETRAPDVEPIDIPVGIVVPAGPFVYDTFTGTGQLSAHVGEIGASWTISPFIQSNGDDTQLVLLSNALQKNGGSTTSAYPSGTIVGSSFYVEFSYRLSALEFSGLSANFYIFDTDAADVGDGVTVLQIFSNVGIELLGGSNFAYSFAANTDYTIRLEFAGANWRLLIDGVEFDTSVRSGAPRAPLMFGLYETGGSLTEISTLTIAAL